MDYTAFEFLQCCDRDVATQTRGRLEPLLCYWQVSSAILTRWAHIQVELSHKTNTSHALSN